MERDVNKQCREWQNISYEKGGLSGKKQKQEREKQNETKKTKNGDSYDCVYSEKNKFEKKKKKKSTQ